MLRNLVKISLPMLKSMTKMLMLSIMEDNSSRSRMDQNSDSKAIAIAKEVTRITKVVRNVVTVELITYLVSVQHMRQTVSSVRRKDISVLIVDLARITNSMDVHSQEDLDINIKCNKMTMMMIGHSP